ncbi:MAG: hypothetical protein SPJ29_07910 [Phocaeicola sp.]|nr:hypothetical protein [Phocaeicola sp.]MDD7448380.1 hypothetical protein [Prevotellaceae bacterium]MDY5939642.1 hypothetical protein [Phocaeicola sp.]
MRKLLILLTMVCCIATSAQNKQKFHGIFNHLGANVSAGTEGISLGIASPLTEYIEVSFGMNFFPKIKISDDINIRVNKASEKMTDIDKVELNGKFARTTCDFKVNCYPFGRKSSFFIAAGASFGGKELVKVDGHSETVKTIIAENPELTKEFIAELDRYDIQFNENGDIFGDARVNSFRPYLGLGFGRLVTKNRMGFRFELGCQFQGKLRFYQNNLEVSISEINKENNSITDITDQIKVYPVLKFSLVGRIF